MKKHTYDFERELEGLTFRAPSRRKRSKYDVFDENDTYITSFGSSIHSQFFDRIGYYSHLDHKDTDRMRNYHLRFKTHSNPPKPRSPLYFSTYYLWAW